MSGLGPQGGSMRRNVGNAVVASLGSSRFVGRDVELAQLHQLRRDAAKGRASIVLIGGEAGLGKSRLLREFMRSLTGGRAPLLASADCLERAPRPLGPFRGLVASIAGAVPKFAAALTPLAQRVLLQLLPYQQTAQHEPEQALDKADLFAGIEQLIASIAQKRATVFTIEDLHWADALTLELLEYLAPRIGSLRMLILITLRDDAMIDKSPLAAAVGRLQRERCVHVMTLQPLSGPAMRDLLVSVLDDTKVASDGALRDIETRSEGNPLYAEELLKSWMDRGARPRELPRSIQGLIAERVGHLNDRERRVLMHAAVLGQSFDPALLAQILGRSLAALSPALRRARELNLIFEDAGARAHFHFRHALTRQALYDNQLALTLRPLHGRIARALEALPDDVDRLDELAYHWWRAGDSERARHYNERAAAVAMGLCAYADAIDYLERTLPLCADPLERARLMGVLGTAARSKGDSDAAIRWCLAAATAFADAERPDEAIGPLLFGCAELANADRFDEASAELERFLVRYGSLLAPADRGRVHCDLLLTRAQRIDSAEPDNAASALESELGAYRNDALLRYWTARMTAHAQLGELTAWRRDVTEARVLLDRDSTGPLLNRASTIQFIGLTALQVAQHDDARRALTASRALLDEHGLRPQLAYLEALHATEAFLSGRLVEAGEAASLAARHSRFVATRAVLGCAGPLIGFALGDKELVRATLFEDAAREVLAHGLRFYSDLACGSVAAAWLATGRVDEARSLLEAAVASIVVVSQAQFIWPLAAQHVGLGSLEQLVSVLNRTMANPEHAVGHAVAAHVDAIAGRRTGDRGRRLRAAGDAVTRYRALGWPMFEAQALELCDMPDVACEIYARCGSIADLDRLARLHERAGGGIAAAASRPLLSKREDAVATLAAECLTNREISDRLHIREKTVEGHLSSVYAKLGLRSRAELVARIANRVEARAGSKRG